MNSMRSPWVSFKIMPLAIYTCIDFSSVGSLVSNLYKDNQDKTSGF